MVRKITVKSKTPASKPKCETGRKGVYKTESEGVEQTGKDGIEDAKPQQDVEQNVETNEPQTSDEISPENKDQAEELPTTSDEKADATVRDEEEIEEVEENDGEEGGDLKEKIKKVAGLLMK